MNKELEEVKKWIKERILYIAENCDLTDSDNKRAYNSLKTTLNYIENSNNTIGGQKYLIQERDQEIIELNQKCILERVAKEEVEELLENSISKETIKEKIAENNSLIEECRDNEEHCGEIYLYEHNNKILKELLEGK